MTSTQRLNQLSFLFPVPKTNLSIGRKRLGGHQVARHRHPPTKRQLKIQILDGNTLSNFINNGSLHPLAFVVVRPEAIFAWLQIHRKNALIVS